MLVYLFVLTIFDYFIIIKHRYFDENTYLIHVIFCIEVLISVNFVFWTRTNEQTLELISLIILGSLNHINLNLIQA